MLAVSRAKRALNSNVGCIVIVASRSNDLFHSFGKCIPFFGLNPGLEAFKWRYCEEKCCAPSHCAFRPNTSAMPVDDALRCSKTNTSARKFHHGVETLEGAKQFTGISRVEACPVITDKVNSFIIFTFRSKFDLGLLHFFCEFPGVVEEVLENDLQKVWVTTHF